MRTDIYSDIFTYIKAQETAYQQGIDLPGNWSWSMVKHIETSYLYTNSQLTTGKNDFKPVKNITRPILNLQHRAEDIDVTDVQIYVDDPDRYHLSFLVKKYHDDVFVQENDMDSFFDELNVSRIDYGAGLSKKLSGPRPEVVPLQSIVFCDQTDILSGPIGLKHFYSPDQILEMADKGWGDPKHGATASIQEVIELARDEKREDQNKTTAKTPGKYIEVYEIHGNFPKQFLDSAAEKDVFNRQLHIVTFYQKQDGTRGNITLYRTEEKENPFKLIKRDAVYGRALGFGGAEELFEAQVWVNYDMIRMQGMLDAASKTILGASGPASSEIARRTVVKDMDNLEIVDLGADSELKQIDTFPRNMALFERSVSEWEAHAQQMGAANDSIMGKSPSAGTPFKLQELVTDESHGLHNYRRGQYAKHLEDIYRDWIIPYITRQIAKGSRFLSELSIDELQYVTECVVRNETNKVIREKILNGETIPPDFAQAYGEKIKADLRKKGNKHFIEILKDEFRDAPLAVKVSIAGKSKNLAAMTDKITNIFRFAFSNPQGFAQVMQIPGMGKSFNQILEYSGLSPVDFSGVEKLAQQQQQPQDAQQAPAQAQQVAAPAYG